MESVSVRVERGWIDWDFWRRIVGVLERIAGFVVLALCHSFVDRRILPSLSMWAPLLKFAILVNSGGFVWLYCRLIVEMIGAFAPDRKTMTSVVSTNSRDAREAK